MIRYRSSHRFVGWALPTAREPMPEGEMLRPETSVAVEATPWVLPVGGAHPTKHPGPLESANNLGFTANRVNSPSCTRNPSKLQGEASPPERKAGTQSRSVLARTSLLTPSPHSRRLTGVEVAAYHVLGFCFDFMQ